ncbi:MAG: glycosyltransferase family 39 protein, partial [Salinibacterium sp.]|nr:glycosyltransferase family 39 protein [Salinibacterium sp.]
MTVLAAPRTLPPPTRARRIRPALVLGLVGTLVGFLSSWNPSYWGDEAASVMSATRPWPSLARELSTIDGVHGVYYAFLHVWTSVFGTSELATRLPSAIAAGAMISGTVVLVRHFSDDRLAVLAGVVAIVLPRTTSMATEARSYAMGAAAAVWLTVLLVVLLRRRVSSRWWVVYGLAMAASAYLFLYLGLLLAVHAAYLLVAHRDAIRSWARGAAVAALLAAPMVLIGYTQREQIDFLSRRNYATLPNVLTKQWFGSVPVALLCWALILVALGWMLWQRRSETQVALLALAWLIIPTAALLVGNTTVSPMYNVRYLTFSTPAAAILVAVGINAVARLLHRSQTRTVAGTALVVILVALCAPVYLAQRGPWAKDGGSDWRGVAGYMQSNAVPGDAVVFDQSTKPSRDPRLAMRLYPDSFIGLRDVALVTPFTETNGLWDTVAPLADTTAALATSTDVWAIELSTGSTIP